MEKEIFDFNIEEMEVFHCQLSPASDPGNENILLNEDELETNKEELNINKEELNTNKDEIDQILHATLSENPSWLFDKMSAPPSSKVQERPLTSNVANTQTLDRKRLFDHHIKLALTSILPDLTENQIQGYTEFLYRAISQVKIVNKN